jgi:hypothetical protein
MIASVISWCCGNPMVGDWQPPDLVHRRGAFAAAARATHFSMRPASQSTTSAARPKPRLRPPPVFPISATGKETGSRFVLRAISPFSGSSDSHRLSEVRQVTKDDGSLKTWYSYLDDPDTPAFEFEHDKRKWLVVEHPVSGPHANGPITMVVSDWSCGPHDDGFSQSHGVR